jgi:hypothetical protein
MNYSKQMGVIYNRALDSQHDMKFGHPLQFWRRFIRLESRFLAAHVGYHPSGVRTRDATRKNQMLAAQCFWRPGRRRRWSNWGGCFRHAAKIRFPGEVEAKLALVSSRVMSYVQIKPFSDCSMSWSYANMLRLTRSSSLQPLKWST